MFPILLIIYGRLVITEEKETSARFGSAFDRYADATPRFPPTCGWDRLQAESVRTK